MDPFTAFFAKHFTQKPSPQQCRKIMSFNILSTVKSTGSMKTWGKSCCTLCMKERIEILDNSRRTNSQIINVCSEVYGACRHIPFFIGLPSPDNPLIDEKVTNFQFSKSTKQKNGFQLVEQNLEKEKITTLERVFLV